MYIHANLNLHTGRLQWIINGPEMHRWHHAMGRGMGSNFSTKLAVWDWMFGTVYLPAGRRARDYGVGSWFPKHYVGQTMYAFRSFHWRARSLAAGSAVKEPPSHIGPELLQFVRHSVQDQEASPP